MSTEKNPNTQPKPADLREVARALVGDLAKLGLCGDEIVEVLAVALGWVAAGADVKYGGADTLDLACDLVEAAHGAALDVLAGPCDCPQCTARKLN